MQTKREKFDQILGTVDLSVFRGNPKYGEQLAERLWKYQCEPRSRFPFLPPALTNNDSEATNHVVREELDYKPKAQISGQVDVLSRISDRQGKQIGLAFTKQGEFSLHPRLQQKYFVNLDV